MGVTVSDPVGKTHRTVLFVDGNRLDESTYRERAGRLVESLNGAQIKVNLFVVRDGVATRISSKDDLDRPQPQHAFPADELVRTGQELGYDQVLLSTGG